MSARHLLEAEKRHREDVDRYLGKSLLQRVILPRAGEPLDVRTLYLEEATTNSRRAHSTSRTSLSVGAESEVSFCHLLQRVPGQLLAPLVAS